MVALALSTRDPAMSIGQPIDALDTPALVLDLDIG